MDADFVIHEKESEFLNNIFESFKITESEVSIISSLDLIQCKQVVREMDCEKKQYAINLFEKMASCDGYIDPREMRIIEEFKGI
jgi:uncharacterized tellurite resistance protein B-like protein